MIQINDQAKFDAVLTTALTKVENNSRWTKAINKAVIEIEANGEFMTYDEAENYLLIWSQGSNEIYSANGVCQCKAFEQGFPCFHRAAARLIRNYMELPENINPAFPTADAPSRFDEQSNAPYLKQSSSRKPEFCGNIRI